MRRRRPPLAEDAHGFRWCDDATGDFALGSAIVRRGAAEAEAQPAEVALTSRVASNAAEETSKKGEREKK